MSDTITDKLAKSLADNVFDTNQQTNVGNRIPSIDVLRQMASTPLEPQNTIEKSMHQGLGRSMMRNTGDFLREGAEAFIDTALFSAPSAFTDWDPSEGVETSAEKWGAGIGGTAGFINPWKATAKGLGWATRKGASAFGKTTTDDLGKILDKTIKTSTAADKAGKTVKTSDDGVEALRWMAGAKESDNIISTFGKMVSHQFKDKIKHWSHTGVKQKDDFTKMINEGFGDSIKRMANAQGIEVSEEAVEQISRKMMKAWDKAGQNPIDNIQSLIAGAFPTSKLASFYGHLFEEAVTFATVDSIMHGMQVAGGKQDADFGAVAKHGFMLGHALGVVRFVPNMGTGEAGVRGGFGSVFNRDGRANWARLFVNSKNYAKSLDPSKESHRGSIGILYKTFDDLGRIPKEGGEHGAASIWRQVKTHMNEWYAKSGNKQYDPGAYTYDHLAHLMKTGSPEQAKNIAQAMQFVLGQVSSQARKKWKPKFLKEWAKDFATATPRMGLGGLVMGNEVIFDENVPLEDKIMTVGIGAFLMRSGKELQYRGADGSHKVIGSLRDFPRKLRDLKETADVVGHKFMKGYRDASGEVVYDIDPQWRKYMEMADKTVEKFNEFENTGFSNVDEATKVVNLLNTSAKSGRDNSINKELESNSSRIKALDSRLVEMEKELPKITVGDKDYNGKNQGEVRPEDLAKLSESKEAKERQELLEQNEILKSEKETTIDLGDYKIFITNDSRSKRTKASDGKKYQGAKYKKNVDKVVETIYNLIKERFSKKDIIGEGKRLKEIDEMTTKEYEMLEQALKDNKLETTRDVQEIFRKANRDNIQNTSRDRVKTALEIIDSLRDGNGDKLFDVEVKQLDNGKSQYTFRTINYGALGRKLTDKTKEALDEYNSLLQIIKGEGEHIILDGNKRIDLDSKHENANWEAVEIVMENSLLAMQKNYGIDGLPKTLTYQDGWLRAAIESTIIDTQIHHSVKTFSRHWEDGTKLGQLLKTIFKGSMGGRGSDKAIAEIFGIDMTIADIKTAWSKDKKFKIQGGSKEDRAMLKDLIEIMNHMPGAETTSPAPTPIDAKIISSISKTQLTKLKNLLNEEGIHILNTDTRFTTTDYAREIARQLIGDKLFLGTTRDGTKLTDNHRKIIEVMMHNGLVNRNLTLTPIGRLLNNVFGKAYDEAAKLEKLSDPAEAKIIIDQMVKDKKISVEEANSMYKTFEEMNAMSVQAGFFAPITFGEMSKTYKELVEPLIVDNKGNGVLTLSTIQTASMGRGEMRLLLDSLMMMKDSTFQSDTHTFVKALQESILNQSGKQTNVKNKLLNYMFAKGKVDPARAYLLAREYKIWDNKNERIDLEGMKETELQETFNSLQSEIESNYSNSYIDNINQRVKELEYQAKDRSNNDSKTIQFNSWMEKWSLKDTKFEKSMITITESKTTSERLFTMLESEYLAKNKTRADFMKDLESALVKANPGINVNEVNAHITKWLIDRENTVMIPVIKINQFSPTMSTFKETKIRKSLMLEELLGVISPDTKIAMFPTEGHLFMKGERGRFGDLTDTGNLATLQGLIYTASGQGNVWGANNASPNASSKLNALSFINSDMVVYRYGNSRHVFGLDARQSNLDYMAGLWVRDLARRTKLDKNDAEYLSEANFDSKMKNDGRLYGEIRILRKNPKTGIQQEIAVNAKDIKNTDQIILSPQNASKTWNANNLEQRVKNILDDMIFGKLLPDVYWSQKLWKAEGAAFLAMMKRTPLTHNISANRFSSEVIREIAAGWTKSTTNFRLPGDKGRDRRTEVRNFIDSWGAGKQKFVVIRDEVDSGFGWNEKGVSESYSVNKKLIDQKTRKIEDLKKGRDEVNKLVNMSKEEKATQLKHYDKIIKQLENEINTLRNSKDASSENGIFIIRDDGAFQAMSILGGEYNSIEVGGIKPTIHGIDSKGNSFVIKTSFQKKLEYEQFFKDNPDVMGITFASSVKKVGADYTDSFKGRMLTGEEFNGGKIGTITDSNKKITLRPEHVSLTAIKGRKDKATITIGNSNHIMDRTAKIDFWNQYYAPSIKELQKNLGDRNDIGRSNERIADARRILGSQFEEKSSSFDMSEGQLSVIDQWLKVGGDPSMFERQYNDAIKSYYLDPILSPKVNGGQSVLSSDTKGELINTVILDGKIWDTGEVFLSRQEAKKEAKIDRITIAERNSAGYDRHYSINQNKKLKNAFIDAMEAKGKREAKYTLQDFVDFVKVYSEQAGKKHKYQVLTAVERIPHVKESSVMLVGIKDFRNASEGNIVILNNADVKRAAEGDYDIDTANIFWESPSSVVKEYARGRGGIQDSRTFEMDSESSSASGLRFDSAKDINEYNSRLHDADMVKGAAMNVSRILQWLQSLTTTHNYVAAKEGKLDTRTGEFDSYTKSTYKPNFVIKAGENTYLVLKEGKELKDVQQLIADYIQSSLDAVGGYNMNRVTIDNMWRDLLYRPETSIFNVMNVNEVAIKGSRTKKTILEKSTETTQSLEGDKQVRKILDGIIDPYKDMLKLSNKIYQDGKGESVSWSALITGIQQANKNLRYLGSKKWYKDNYLTDKNINFHDIGKNAALDKAASNNANLPMYDRVLANVMHLHNVTMNPNKSITLSEPFRDSFELLMTTKTAEDAYDAVKKELTDSYKLTDFINQAQKELNELHEYKEKFRDYKTRDRILKYSIKPLEKRLNFLKNQISIELQDYGKIRATSKAEEKTKLKKKTKGRDGKKYEQNKKIVDNIIERYAQNLRAEKLQKLKEQGDPRLLTKDEMKAVNKKAIEMFLKKGFYIEPTVTNEMIKYIAINDVFGRINVMNHNELKLSQGKFTDINKEISQVIKEFGESVHDLMDVHKEVLNWDHLYENTFQKLDKIARDHERLFESEDMAYQWILAKVAAPGYEPNTFVQYGGAFFQAPKMKGVDKYINLGFRWYMRQYSEKGGFSGFNQVKMSNLFRPIAQQYNQAWWKMNGMNTGVREEFKDSINQNDSYYFQPFEFTKGTQRQEFLNHIFPNAESFLGVDYSRIDAYQQMNDMLGSGLIRDIVLSEQHLDAPYIMKAGAERYKYIDSIKDMHEGEGMGGGAAITRRGFNDVFHDPYTLDSRKPVHDRSWEKHKNVVDLVEFEVKKSMEDC